MAFAYFSNRNVLSHRQFHRAPLQPASEMGLLPHPPQAGHLKPKEVWQPATGYTASDGMPEFKPEPVWPLWLPPEGRSGTQVVCSLRLRCWAMWGHLTQVGPEHPLGQVFPHPWPLQAPGNGMPATTLLARRVRTAFRLTLNPVLLLPAPPQES